MIGCGPLVSADPAAATRFPALFSDPGMGYGA